MFTKDRILKIILYVVICALPGILLYWLVPFASDITIGNDYKIFPIQHQMELNYSQEKGSFPLYVPGFAEGRSQAALTLGQMYHPISHMAAATPGYWDGDALSINTVYRLLFLGFTHLIVFIFFRRLNIGIIPSFIISAISVYNLRMLDMFRYGASLENYTGYLLLCTAMGFYSLKPTKFAGPIAIIGATYLLVCGGHPQIMYLGLLGAAIVCLALPFALPAINPQIQFNPKKTLKFYGMVGLCVGLGIAVSAAYVASFYFEFVADNALRVGQNYKWSLAYSDSIGGALDNLFAPLNADVHGAFGSSSIIVLSLLVPLIFALRRRVPAAILVLVGILVTIFLSSAGDTTKLHYWFWKYFPLAQTFRVPGRLSMLLPFTLALVLAWLFAQKNQTQTFRNKTLPFSPVAPMAVLGIGIFIIFHQYIREQLPPPGRYVPFYINKYEDWVEPAIFWLSIVSLGLAALFSIHIKWKPTLWRTVFGTLLCCSVLAQIGVQLRHGTWTKPNTPYKTLEQMDQEKRHKLAFKGSPGFGNESTAVTNHMKNATLEKSLAKFYRKAIRVKNEKQAYKALLTQRTPDTIVLEKCKKTIGTSPPDNPLPDKIDLTYSSFNRLVFNVTANGPGFISMAHPYDGRWRATVDEIEQPVYKANGIENAVFVGVGSHTVEYRYESLATVVGALISTLTLIVIGLFFGIKHLKGIRRWMVCTGVLMICIGLFWGWNQTLYTGDNLETRYTWDSSQFPPSDNLAFGKRAKMSSIRSQQMPYFYYAGLAVDGDKTGRPFATHRKRGNPWWQVDLGKAQSLDHILIYDRRQGRRNLPLDIFISNNGNKFKRLKRITDRGRSAVWKIPLDGATTRFVRLQSRARYPMGFYEVEIYPHKGPPPFESQYTDRSDPTGNLRYLEQKTRRYK